MSDIGDFETIPDFSLPASTGQTLSRESFAGKVPVVLVFLGDLVDDLGLLHDLNRHLSDFGAERSQLLAVARATAAQVRSLAEAESIVMPILADAAGAMSRDYGAEDETGERNRLAIVADEEGRVVRRFQPLPVDGAVGGLLTTVRALGSGAVGAPPAREAATLDD